MARRSTPVKQQASLTPEQIRVSIERLKRRVEDVRKFNPGNVHDQYNIPDVEALSASIDEALSRTFGNETVDYERYKNASYFDNGPHNYAYDVPISEVRQSLSKSRARNIALLEQAIAALEERLQEEAATTTSNPAAATSVSITSKRIFVVHGHAGVEDSVARFLMQLKFRPVILHEEANEGRTIIEKFEAHADVGFAVVLLTDDDVGGEKNGPQKPRPRQNVVLELGYFIGKLGRKRVCALKRGEIEFPSDILGVIWTEFDSNGGWRQKLAKELQAAGYDIDWNLLMRS